MNDKQIFAAVEVSDHEARLIVGEFFNTRFNIIKVERVACSGFDGVKITDPAAVTSAVKQAVDNAHKMIGASIKSAILAMPSYGMKRYSFKSTVDITGIDQTVTVQDVRNAMAKAQNMDIGKDYALIQTVNVRYTVNGISTRRIPIGEKCSSLSVDIDLLCANRTLSYEMCSCVEKAGIKIMDIFLDVYAAGKEAALFEQSVNQQMIVLKVERQSTSLGLLRKGRLTTAMVMPIGIGTIAGSLTDQYGISPENAVELFKYSAVLNNPNPSDNPVHIWSAGGKTHTITEKELIDCVMPGVNAWASYIQKTCAPILQAGQTAVIITGEGGETQGLAEVLGTKLQVNVRSYVPDTLGGRNAGLTTSLGLFYAYQDRLPITGYTDDSIDMDAFIKAVSYRDKKNEGNAKEDTLTSKLKGLFLDNKR
ncbi:MAG: cell division protein FtsA [Lactimicrobium massiliense]|nr:cell division protein FtsA [Lactimicrobium massiliense]MDD6560852.1 cell division protein FtsA [Lactimicrobium massiliense]